MKKRFIKLINDERQRAEVKSSKGCVNAYDTCSTIDEARCTTYAYDKCNKDYNACSEGADDVCSYIDRGYCTGSGTEDNCSSDWTNCSGSGTYDNA